MRKKDTVSSDLEPWGMDKELRAEARRGRALLQGQWGTVLRGLKDALVTSSQMEVERVVSSGPSRVKPVVSQEHGHHLCVAPVCPPPSRCDHDTNSSSGS